MKASYKVTCLKALLVLVIAADFAMTRTNSSSIHKAEEASEGVRANLHAGSSTTKLAPVTPNNKQPLPPLPGHDPIYRTHCHTGFQVDISEERRYDPDNSSSPPSIFTLIQIRETFADPNDSDSSAPFPATPEPFAGEYKVTVDNPDFKKQLDEWLDQQLADRVHSTHRLDKKCDKPKEEKDAKDKDKDDDSDLISAAKHHEGADSDLDDDRKVSESASEISAGFRRCENDRSGNELSDDEVLACEIRKVRAVNLSSHRQEDRDDAMSDLEHAVKFAISSIKPDITSGDDDRIDAAKTSAKELRKILQAKADDRHLGATEKLEITKLINAVSALLDAANLREKGEEYDSKATKVGQALREDYQPLARDFQKLKANPQLRNDPAFRQQFASDQQLLLGGVQERQQLMQQASTDPDFISPVEDLMKMQRGEMIGMSDYNSYASPYMAFTNAMQQMISPSYLNSPMGMMPSGFDSSSDLLGLRSSAAAMDPRNPGISSLSIPPSLFGAAGQTQMGLQPSLMGNYGLQSNLLGGNSGAANMPLYQMLTYNPGQPGVVQPMVTPGPGARVASVGGGGPLFTSSGTTVTPRPGTGGVYNPY